MKVEAQCEEGRECGKENKTRFGVLRGEDTRQPVKGPKGKSYHNIFSSFSKRMKSIMLPIDAKKVIPNYAKDVYVITTIDHILRGKLMKYLEIA